MVQRLPGGENVHIVSSSLADEIGDGMEGDVPDGNHDDEESGEQLPNVDVVEQPVADGHVVVMEIDEDEGVVDKAKECRGDDWDAQQNAEEEKTSLVQGTST